MVFSVDFLDWDGVVLMPSRWSQTGRTGRKAARTATLGACAPCSEHRGPDVVYSSAKRLQVVALGCGVGVWNPGIGEQNRARVAKAPVGPKRSTHPNPRARRSQLLRSDVHRSVTVRSGTVKVHRGKYARMTDGGPSTACPARSLRAPRHRGRPKPRRRPASVLLKPRRRPGRRPRRRPRRRPEREDRAVLEA